jgi:pyruvate/2-oxoglutarate dehydrogenase complex dihydrolipoamide acyltransferase (E2) component
MNSIARVAGPLRRWAHTVPELTHANPLFPSVHRLLLEHASSIPNAADIKGTGIRGMLTKGDVLAFLGKASGPLGSYEGKEVKGEVKTVKTEGAKIETAKVCIFLSILCVDDTIDVFRWYSSL